MHVSDQNQRRQYKKHIKNIKYAQQTLFTDSVWYRLAERGICLSAIVGEISPPFPENLFARSRAASVCRKAALARVISSFPANKIGQLSLSYDVAEKEGFAFQRSLARKAAFSENSFARSRAASVCRIAALARGTPFFFAKHKSRNIEKDNLYRVVLCLAEKEGVAFQRSLAR